MKSKNLEKQPTTTNPEGERLPKAQFSKFRFVKPTLRIDKSQTTTGKWARFDETRPTGPKQAILHYVSNGNLVFTSEKASIRNDEAYEILLVENPEERKNTKKPTRQISTTKSAGLTGAKIRVLTLDALELRLSMFQRSTNLKRLASGRPKKLSKGLAKGLVLIYLSIFLSIYLLTKPSSP